MSDRVNSREQFDLLNATGPSSTPPRASATHTSTIKSTPNSRGAAVISSHINFLGAE